MSKHNAPWETKPTASLGPQWGVYDDNGRDVAIVYDHDDMTEDKARLNAAAPDLLAACKSAVAHGCTLREMHEAIA
jgi:hypothetical protein